MSEAMVRIYANEYRCGQFELEQGNTGSIEVPKWLWDNVVAADAALAEATGRQVATTLAVVRYVADRHPDNEVFAEWARLGTGAF